MDASKLNAPPFDAEDAKMIKSTRIRVGRNLDGFPLGPGITNEQRIAIEKNVSEAVKNFTGDLAGTYYPLNKLTDV
jgi:creatine kinase